MNFSLIIPVFNRPNEIDELLLSLTKQTYTDDFEVVIIEDGSTETSELIIKKYSSLSISYFFKNNSGPGDSRNFGMKKAKGDYFIILDSDCIIPQNYLLNIENALQNDYVDCFGGPDAAHESFSNTQKGINFAMTSFLTTGGIRGGSEKINKFQPRSFNMGISKKAFEATKGFNNIHPGEDPDLTIRLWKLGFQTKLISDAFVYHKRRINWKKFYTQVNKFGLVRPILNNWHKEYIKITFWFPTIFIISFFVSLLFMLINIWYFVALFCVYFLVLFMFATVSCKSLIVGFNAVIATCIQFYGYGLGFLRSWFTINVLGKSPEEAFPKLFFKTNSFE